MGRIEERLMREWRELGFYYDCDYRIGVNQWRFYGSKKGLQNFADILSQYAADKTNDEISEHIHLGPYSYLKIMTWDSPQIHRDYFAGTLEDFKQLSGIIKKFLAECSPGDTFTLHDHFGVNN